MYIEHYHTPQSLRDSSPVSGEQLGGGVLIAGVAPYGLTACLNSIVPSGLNYSFFIKLIILVVSIGLGKGFGLADVEPSDVFELVALEGEALADREIEGDDGEFALPLGAFAHVTEQSGGDDVDALESQLAIALGIEGKAVGFHLSRSVVEPAVEAHVGIEEKLAGGGAFADQKGSIGTTCHMLVIDGSQVDVAEDIDIVNEERLVTIQEGPGLEDAATRIQQLIALVADVDVYAEVIVSLQEINDLLSEMVDVDGDIVEAC